MREVGLRRLEIGFDPGLRRFGLPCFLVPDAWCLTKGTRDRAGPLSYGMDSTSLPFAVPSRLSVLPLRDVVVFPNVAMPLLVGRQASLGAIEAAASEGGLLASYYT